MIMADVFAIFGTLLVIGIALPGLLLTWRLVFPAMVNVAEQRLGHTPWSSFFVGGAVLIGASIPLMILFSLPWAGFKLIGFIGTLLLMTVTSIGAAGLATMMGRRLQQDTELTLSAATVRGAIAMELAAVFPLIGWFLFIPITFVVTLGAATFALLRWAPNRGANDEIDLRAKWLDRRLALGEK